jgi:hypothetical protein
MTSLTSARRRSLFGWRARIEWLGRDVDRSEVLGERLGVDARPRARALATLSRVRGARRSALRTPHPPRRRAPPEGRRDRPSAAASDHLAASPRRNARRAPRAARTRHLPARRPPRENRHRACAWPTPAPAPRPPPIPNLIAFEQKRAADAAGHHVKHPAGVVKPCRTSHTGGRLSCARDDCQSGRTVPEARSVRAFSSRT